MKDKELLQKAYDALCAVIESEKLEIKLNKDVYEQVCDAAKLIKEKLRRK